MIGSRLTHQALSFLTGITVAVFMVMALVTMPRLEVLGGSPFFDARFSGYDKADVKALVGQLGQPGADFHRTIQHPIDSAFSALFFVTASGWLIVLSRRLPLPRFISLLPIAIALVGLLADRMENAAILNLLTMGTEKIDDEPVMTASISTMVKFACSLAVLAIVGIEALVVVMRRRDVSH